MLNQDYLSRFRACLGHAYFEGKDASVLAQFIHSFVFVEAPEEIRLELFSDFIMNFGGDPMPPTAFEYDFSMDLIPKSDLDHAAKRMQHAFRDVLIDLTYSRRLPAQEFAEKVFNLLRSYGHEEAIVAVYILIVSWDIPYRFVKVETVIRPDAVNLYASDVQQAWIDTLNGARLFHEGKAIDACRDLARMIESYSEVEGRVIQVFLCASAIVYLTRDFGLRVRIMEDDAETVLGFELNNAAFLADCGEVVAQRRFGDRKFRNFFDQASYLLTELFGFPEDTRHLALFFMLNTFQHQAERGQKNLPVGAFLPFSWS